MSEHGLETGKNTLNYVCINIKLLNTFIQQFEALKYNKDVL